MPYRKTAVAVGVLFLVQLVTYMLGASLIEAFADGGTARTAATAGVGLTTVSGLAVVGIGLLLYRVLRDVDPRLAIWYPVLRVVEFAVSAVFGVVLVTQGEVVPSQHLWVYVPTGVGGLILTHLLYVSRLVPRPIAVVGFLGYGLLLLGVPLDLIGVLDMGEGPGLALLAPGGLFEVVLLPGWLIAKGFRAPASGATHRSAVPAIAG